MLKLKDKWLGWRGNAPASWEQVEIHLWCALFASYADRMTRLSNRTKMRGRRPYLLSEWRNWLLRRLQCDGLDVAQIWERASDGGILLSSIFDAAAYRTIRYVKWRNAALLGWARRRELNTTLTTS